MRSDINDLDRPGTRGNACNISHTFVWKSLGDAEQAKI
jgi:hypothetical protein